MSIEVSTDVFCDYPGCGAWHYGVTGTVAKPTSARDAAKRYGWRRRRFADPDGSFVVDLCDEHADIVAFPPVEVTP